MRQPCLDAVDARIPARRIASPAGRRRASACRATEREHRGGFGEFGGETVGALIDRTFRERIVLVGVSGRRRTRTTPKPTSTSSPLLVDTAGADAVGRVVQRRDAPDPATYVGKGKAEEIRELSEAVDADTVVFDDELTPGPAAQPREAARPHRHRPHRGDPRHLRPERPQPGGQGPGRAGPAPLPAAPPAGPGPRLLSQQAGGIGTRAARARPSSRSTAAASCAASTKLEAELARACGRHRDDPAQGPPPRSRSPRVAIVGYTNAGKSTLLNRLTDAGVLVEDRLFATLDADHPPPASCPAARRCC